MDRRPAIAPEQQRMLDGARDTLLHLPTITSDQELLRYLELSMQRVENPTVLANTYRILIGVLRSHLEHHIVENPDNLLLNEEGVVIAPSPPKGKIFRAEIEHLKQLSISCASVIDHNWKRNAEGLFVVFRVVPCERDGVRDTERTLSTVTCEMPIEFQEDARRTAERNADRVEARRLADLYLRYRSLGVRVDVLKEEFGPQDPQARAARERMGLGKGQ